MQEKEPLPPFDHKKSAEEVAERMTSEKDWECHYMCVNYFKRGCVVNPNHKPFKECPFAKVKTFKGQIVLKMPNCLTQKGK